MKIKGFNPFSTPVDAPKQTGFDEFYYDITEKEVFKATGESDEDGEALGTIEKKFIVKKIDINEYLCSQRDSVGVENYMKALLLQGDSIDNYSTTVSDEIVDTSEMPDTLAEVMIAGDKAKAAFASLDPALKGGHTTIEGFLNSLSSEVIENYIKGKVDAMLPKNEASNKGGE